MDYLNTDYIQESKSEDFMQSLFPAFSLIKIIPHEFYRDKIKEANQICKQFDEKDTPFVALALKLNIPIWTNDKKLLVSSKEYKAISSKDLQKRLEEL
ncbi:hypothetical protein DRO97_11195 [Archaeoglobales archaeon]|nr:MAG: hypothetical protein DRO97_11195 [Archaeoglobales archaeon]